MKPYCKTFRVRKDHKANECGICAERCNDNKKHKRREGVKEITMTLDQTDV